MMVLVGAVVGAAIVWLYIVIDELVSSNDRETDEPWKR